ncbi:MAG: glycosyltransferase family 2 protein [Moraxellaceae bacterium]|jgi:glycosyltransferase involved in cell wall biosynthesis|nr:glycosyltransferase family 2 protein [Moraxellaceae bacterium]
MALPRISVVLTVFNKAAFLPATLASLHGQDGSGSEFALEFVVVDDASRDDSLAVVEAFFAAHPADVNVIRNEQNAGPSVRLNQGIRAAQGDHVFVFDADDIAPRNVLRSMLAALGRENLDYVYGRSQKTALPAAEAAALALPEPPELVTSDEPLQLTLARGVVLPIVLVKREVALRAGGCDDKVFVQDESLALWLALAGRRMGLLEHPCRYVLVTPEEAATGKPSAAHLSANVAQQHHDQYLTYLHLLARPDLPSRYRALLARKAVSPWWKSVRKQGFQPVALFWYLLSRAFPLFVLTRQRIRLDSHFAQLPKVRRIA